ncbi:5-formyltetrahydrofolate cyclo-ligase [Oceanobacillus sp. FSL K6-2867]|uniref:5-formyltetrahydrofolate cyclo-ligase n=1 Tax=Oceanobacillus sp. FSL K6-2867 TaxID=2954748 RepID=UPI0030DBFF59
MKLLDKTNLRKETINRLKSLSIDEKRKIEVKLMGKLLSSELWKYADTIGLTISQDFEWATGPIIEAGWKQNKKIVVPKCIPNEKQLHFYAINSFEQLESVYFNLLEPIPETKRFVAKKDIDLLIVPGLLFDKHGYRIGFGGGYYDRFLVDFSQKTASLCSFKQLVDRVPREKYDLPVHNIITEKEVIHTQES